MKQDWINATLGGVIIAALIVVAVMNVKTPTYLITVGADGTPVKVERFNDRGECLVAIEKAYEQGPIPERLHCVDAK